MLDTNLFSGPKVSALDEPGEVREEVGDSESILGPLWCLLCPK